MVDLSNLQLVAEDIPVVDDASYVDATDFPPPPPEGVYLFTQGAPKFEASKDGFLVAVMDQTIADGDFANTKIMFDRVSAKTFERGGVRVSMMQDHLRAVYPTGAPERSARTNDEKAAAIAAAEGKPFKGVVQWDGYCGHKDTEYEGQDGVSVRGQRNFPNGGDAKCSKCGGAIRPRARINRRIAQ